MNFFCIVKCGRVFMLQARRSPYYTICCLFKRFHSLLTCLGNSKAAQQCAIFCLGTHQQSYSIDKLRIKTNLINLSERELMGYLILPGDWGHKIKLSMLSKS